MDTPPRSQPATPVDAAQPSAEVHPPATREAIGLPGTIAVVLLIVGGLNWALVALFNFDVVGAVFGEATLGARIVYLLVGLAAIYALLRLPRWSRTN